MVTFNTAQRRMSLQVQLEIMRQPLIDEIEAAAKIKVFRDTHDIEATGRHKNRRINSRHPTSQLRRKHSSPTMPRPRKRRLQKTTGEGQRLHAAGVDVGDIADVVDMLKRVAQDIHPLMQLVYADEQGKKFYFSGGGTFLTGFSAACGYVRNRNNMKMLDGALEKLIALLKQPSEDPLGLTNTRNR